jgi:TolB-like protein
MNCAWGTPFLSNSLARETNVSTLVLYASSPALVTPRVAINKLREALCDSASEPRYIETVPRRGYRFLAKINRADPPNTPPVAPPTPTSLEPSETWRGRRLAGVAAIATVLILAGIRFIPWLRSEPPLSLPNGKASIAVLPFTDMSSNKNQEYLSDGLAEELIGRLARTPGLRVIGRSSAFQFKGKNEDLRGIGRKLGVAYLLEGSVRTDGERVRVTAELTKTDDGFQVWSQSFDGSMRDIFKVEDEIGTAVAAALPARILGRTAAPFLVDAASSAGNSTTPEAYQAYLKACALEQRWIVNDLKSALVFVDRSIELDSRFAPARALRSSVYIRLAEMGLVENEAGFRNARADAEQAIALDPSLAVGYVRLAQIQLNHDWNCIGAQATLDKARQLEPGSVTVLRAQSYLFRVVGRMDESVALEQQAVALDPLQAASFGGLAIRLYFAGRDNEALAAQQRALELDPQAEFIHFNRGEVLLAKRIPQEALKEMEQEPGETWSLTGKAVAYHDLGRNAESDARLAN